MIRAIWLALAVLGLIDAAWLLAANFRLAPAGAIAPAASAMALVGAAAFLHYRRRNRAAVVLLHGIAQILPALPWAASSATSRSAPTCRSSIASSPRSTA